MATRTQFAGRRRFDTFEVDLFSGEIWERGVRVRLQEQPFQILRALLERPGEIVTRDELKQMLWPGDTFGDFNDGLNTAVKKIRDLLGDSAERPSYIETIPRCGYRFVGTLVLTSDAEPSVKDGRAQPVLKTSVWWKASRLAAYAVLGILAIVLALLGTKLVGGWPPLASSLSTPRIGALAVLPLDDLSDRAEEQDYFADGITDELITQLAQLPSLRVISRTSVMQYKGAHKPLPQIARELGVDAVLEGSVTRSEGHVRITAQLIDARSDTHLWSAEYSRETRDILSLQREVTSDIARQIRLQFLVPQKAKLDVARPVDPEAYELFLKGLYFWDQRTIASIKHATDYFKQSTRKDPDFAPAWAYLSTTYCMLEREGADSPQAEYPQALQYVQKALQLDPLSSEAHTAMGCIHNLFEWDWKQAEAEFKKAIELNPNYGLAHQWYSFTLLRIGRNDAAIEEMKRALAVDPTSLRVNMTCAFTMLNARHYREAINKFQAAIELFPQEARLHRGLSEAYEGAGRHHEASQEFENFLSSDSFGREFLRFCQPFDYARCKLRFVGEEAQRELGGLERGRKNGDYISPARYASVYLRLGNKTKAIHWLQEAYKQHSSYLLIFRAPEFDILRLEPEFQELVAQVELPQTEQ